jgi:hypothetical protein
MGQKEKEWARSQQSVSLSKKKYSEKISHAATPRPPLPFPHFLPSPPRLQPSPPRRSNRPLLSAALVRTAPEPPPLPIIPSPAALRSDPIRSPASLPFPSSPHASTVESAESEGSYGTRPGCLLAWLGFERAQSPFRFSRPQSLSILSSLD